MPHEKEWVSDWVVFNVTTSTLEVTLVYQSITCTGTNGQLNQNNQANKFLEITNTVQLGLMKNAQKHN